MVAGAKRQEKQAAALAMRRLLRPCHALVTEVELRAEMDAEGASMD